MDVLRHTGRAQLSSFIGGSNAAADARPVGLRPLHRGGPQKQIDDAPQLYGRLGTQSVEDLERSTSPASTPTSPTANVNPT